MRHVLVLAAVVLSGAQAPNKDVVLCTVFGKEGLQITTSFLPWVHELARSGEEPERLGGIKQRILAQVPDARDVMQAALAEMYFDGKCVPQDDELGFFWSQKAAEQGNRWGQFLLGAAYFRGQGTPRDYVLAYMWFNLAAAQGHKASGEIRDALAAQSMTLEQVAEAQRLAREWVARQQ